MLEGAVGILRAFCGLGIRGPEAARSCGSYFLVLVDSEGRYQGSTFEAASMHGTVAGAET